MKKKPNTQNLFITKTANQRMIDAKNKPRMIKLTDEEVTGFKKVLKYCADQLNTGSNEPKDDNK